MEYESENDSSGCDSPRNRSSPKVCGGLNTVSTSAVARSTLPCSEVKTDNVPPTSTSDYQNLVYLSKFPDFPVGIKPDDNTMASIKYYTDAMINHNFNLVEHIRGYRDFGNPYILSNVVDHFAIDQYGTNYPPELFDPKNYPEVGTFHV